VVKVGTFSILPVTAEAASKLDTGDIKGIEIRGEHISPSLRNAAGAYISWVIAGEPAKEGNILEKAATLRLVNAHLEKLRKEGITVFFTRPFTDDGVRMCVKLGFATLSGSAPQKEKACKKLYPQLSA
jgi:hypothetical protein